MGSLMKDSTNHGLRIFGEKVPESSKAKPEFAIASSNYLYGIYIVLGMTGNLEMTYI